MSRNTASVQDLQQKGKDVLHQEYTLASLQAAILQTEAFQEDTLDDLVVADRQKDTDKGIVGRVRIFYNTLVLFDVDQFHLISHRLVWV